MERPIVLLHGFSQAAESWRPVTGALARLSGQAGSPPPAVSTPDLRGHGAAAAARPVSLDAVLGDLDAVVEPGATLCGYSMGGRIALHYALRRPGRLQSLVLVGATPGIAQAGERAARRAADERLAERIETAGIESFAREWAALPLWQGEPPEVSRRSSELRLRQSPQGLAAALRALGTGALPSLWERLPELALPVRLLVGARDVKFRQIAAAMAERLTDARVVVIPAAGHAAHLEAPDAVARVLLAPP